MTVDMGGIAWPVRGATTASAQVGQVTLERRTAYVGSPLGVTAVGTDGQPYTGSFALTLTADGRTEKRTVTGGVLSTAGLPQGKYRVSAGNVSAGNLIVL